MVHVFEGYAFCCDFVIMFPFVLLPFAYSFCVIDSVFSVCPHSPTPNARRVDTPWRVSACRSH